jgi:hypothetical protein
MQEAFASIDTTEIRDKAFPHYMTSSSITFKK